jgi:hypothetical protein
MTLEQQYASLVESLQLVAATYSEQCQALPDFVDVTDEVGTTFGDAYLLVPQLVRGGMVSKEAAISLKELDDWFCEMPKDGSIVGLENLKNHEFWKHARILARYALGAIKENRRPPNLQHIHWVE